jgi:TIR domain
MPAQALQTTPATRAQAGMLRRRLPSIVDTSVATESHFFCVSARPLPARQGFLAEFGRHPRRSSAHAYHDLAALATAFEVPGRDAGGTRTPPSYGTSPGAWREQEHIQARPETAEASARHRYISELVRSACGSWHPAQAIYCKPSEGIGGEPFHARTRTLNLKRDSYARKVVLTLPPVRNRSGNAMIEVFVSYAGKDRGAAMPIIEALAQAGLKLWDGDAITSGPVPEQVRRQLQAAQCVVILWSQAAAQSPYVQVEIHEAIQAWSTDRLVLAALDDTPLPVGLRDLPAISIRDPFDSSTRKLIEHVQATVRRAAIVASESAPAPVEAPPPARSAILAARRFPLFASIIAAALAAGFAVLVAVTVMWLPADTSDSPSPPPPLGPSLPTNFSPEPASPLLLMLLILGAAIGAGAVWVWTSRSRRRLDRAPSTALSPPALAASSSGLQVFISYSRHDRQAVEQLVRQIEQLGYAVWIDRQ